ncbi:MAG TPA: D-alanyl-lipoteichoic acid biosynthesis protein DltD [Bacteroidia bacterium]|nr:D-alanyl-lipoteichoic acid biosynthesis protein DltD [Bacteroidia bacterium]
MKQFIAIYLIPFIVSIIFTYQIASYPPLNQSIFKENKTNQAIDTNYRFIEHFNHLEFYENDFLHSNSNVENIYMLGSSELTHNSDAIPYQFISNRFDVKVKGVGHAGNQCLSILTQLLAKAEIIKHAPIVIILSPSWFESKTSKGSPSSVFLEFNSNRFLHQIINDKNHNFYCEYVYKRVSDMYQEFNSPNLEIRIMYAQHQASKSWFLQVLYKPILVADKELIGIRNEINPLHPLSHKNFERKAINPNHIKINWDSLFAASKSQVLKNASNNHLGIANELYSEYANKKGRVQPVALHYNQELQDMQMLIKFLNEKHAKASFVISPLNPFYYKNLKDLNPTIQQIEDCLQKYGFNYLNLFESDTAKYDKALLFDVMHLSDYGWYKIDQFIIENYHLTNAS